MKPIAHITVLSIFFIWFVGCKDNSASSSKDKVVVSFKKEGVLTIKSSDSDSIIKTLDIEIADDAYQIETGLMYRSSMSKNQGMLFIFPNEQMRSFYMKNTKIPLDIIYINSEKSIVSFQKNAIPFDDTSLPSEAPAKYVLEIYAGLSDEWNIKLGDKISFMTQE